MEKANPFSLNQYNFEIPNKGKILQQNCKQLSPVTAHHEGKIYISKSRLFQPPEGEKQWVPCCCMCQTLCKWTSPWCTGWISVFKSRLNSNQYFLYFNQYLVFKRQPFLGQNAKITFHSADEQCMSMSSLPLDLYLSHGLLRWTYLKVTNIKYFLPQNTPKIPLKA